MCGEKTVPQGEYNPNWGSPPRVRGKVDHVRLLIGEDGITPACAGKRSSLGYTVSVAWDHPRACGEKSLKIVDTLCAPGSPPRMRGKDCSTSFRVPSPGITPAHAGKRHPQATTLGSVRDHPRACGEKLLSLDGYVCHGGSPPRMRGKAACALSPHRPSGITPAHAGKSTKCFRRTCTSRGSPPRMRGKANALSMPDIISRITPAHAGKSFAAAGADLRSGDHPRACGEKLFPSLE